MDPEILGHYERGVELERLAGGSSRIEFARTKELLERHLPQVPARVLDVGGAPGVYAGWLAEQGYEVTLVDPVPKHMSETAARAERSARPFTAGLGDARDLEQADGTFDVVLLFGRRTTSPIAPSVGERSPRPLVSSARAGSSRLPRSPGSRRSWTG